MSCEPIKREILTSQDSTATSSFLPEDIEPSPRFSFIQNRELEKLVTNISIYVEAMRCVVNKVIFDSKNLSHRAELDLLKLAVQCIDLTTLSGDDTRANVERLCLKATTAVYSEDGNTMTRLKCAAVCVYPARVTNCQNTLRVKLEDQDVKIASVATAFPSGQCGLKTRLAEIIYAVESGANEVDVVINRAAALEGDWITVHHEISEMRRACDVRLDEGHEVHLKVIIAAGDLLTSSPESIYMASLIAILAGADFIKTSTGKESINATLCIGYIMMRAIVSYYCKTNVKIGFKPAGGIKTYDSTLQWLLLTKMILGDEWLSKEYFRFGASGVLDDIAKRIKELEQCIKNERGSGSMINSTKPGL